MIHDSTENNCLHLHASCMEDMIPHRLHMLVFHHLLCRWCVHVAVGVYRPWVNCSRASQGGGGGRGGSSCGRISCCSGNGCGCSCGYGYGSGGDGGGGSGKFCFEYT